MMNIALCCDERYLAPALFTIISVDARLKSDAHVHILGDKLSEEAQGLLKNVTRCLNRVTGVTLYRSTGLPLPASFFPGHVSRAAFLRLFLQDILPQNIARLVYLDVDMMINCDIGELFQVDLHGEPIAATRDAFFTTADFLQDHLFSDALQLVGKPYFNSGVMVMNLDHMRRNHWTAKAEAILKKHAVNLPHWDQDVLNLLCNGDWFELPSEWNEKVHFYGNTERRSRYRYIFERMALIGNYAPLRKAKIIHFTSTAKPWTAGFGWPAVPQYRARAMIYRARFSDYRRALSMSESFVSKRGSDTSGP